MNPPAPSQPKRDLSRRNFLACAAFGALGMTSYAGLVAPFDLEIGRHQFLTRNPQPGNELKLLHLSDLHASFVVSLEFIERAIDLGLSLKPDLVCLTGDYITTKYDRFNDYARLLGKLSAAAPTFACLGNHDGGIWSKAYGGYPDSHLVRQLLHRSGIELLANHRASLRLKGRDLVLIGAQDGWSEPVNIAAAFPRADHDPDATRLLLTHNPDTKTWFKSHPWDLMLCGHTHGGQVVLPLLGAGFFAPVDDKQFIAGMLPWENRWIHITRGVGNVRGFRFNCPPEVSLITLV